MAIDYGVDISATFDVDPSLRLVSGQRLVLEALLRRLITPRGGLFYDTNYGFDVRQFLNAAYGPAELSALQNGVEAECEKDERVESARCSLRSSPSEALLKVDLLTRFGPFSLTLSVSSVSVALLTTDAAA